MLQQRAEGVLCVYLDVIIPQEGRGIGWKQINIVWSMLSVYWVLLTEPLRPSDRKLFSLAGRFQYVQQTANRVCLI